MTVFIIQKSHIQLIQLYVMQSWLFKLLIFDHLLVVRWPSIFRPAQGRSISLQPRTCSRGYKDSLLPLVLCGVWRRYCQNYRESLIRSTLSGSGTCCSVWDLDIIFHHEYFAKCQRDFWHLSGKRFLNLDPFQTRPNSKVVFRHKYPTRYYLCSLFTMKLFKIVII